MNNDIKLLASYFKRLGIDEKGAFLYLALQQYGPQTISQLARSSGVERIQIYRLLDGLQDSGVIEIETKYKRSILHAAPLTKLQVLLTKREQELKDLQQDFVRLSEQLQTRSMHARTTRVQFYEGMDGIKQMLWGQTKTKTENLAILYDNMQNKTNAAFFERWVQKCNERNVKFRGIIGDHFIKTQQAWYEKHSNERLKNWQGRYISDTMFPLELSVVVYNDTVLQYNWNSDRIFGIETQDPAIARMQRQFFEVLWQQAAPVDDLSGVKQ
jgi:sugar-specific transcriptional regulator TrmB